MTRSLRPLVTISNSVNQRLTMYAVAASATGVGCLALAQSAEAKIVYTPAHIRIHPNSTIELDLNHDGINDFKLSAFYLLQSTRHAGTGGLAVLPPRANAVWQADGSAANLPAGFRIGAATKNQFSGGFLFMAAMFQTYRNLVTWGPWAPHAENRYLGLRFAIRGKTHYGWARLSVKIGFGGASGELTGYAYETIPGKAIKAGATKGSDEGEFSARNTPTPEPSTLGMLALGSAGLPIWRRGAFPALRQ